MVCIGPGKTAGKQMHGQHGPVLGKLHRKKLGILAEESLVHSRFKQVNSFRAEWISMPVVGF